MDIIVAPFGKATVTVPAAGSIAVFSRGQAVVSRLVGFPNEPEQLSVVGTVAGGQTIFGPYANGATIVIESGSSQSLYNFGAGPVVQLEADFRIQSDPVAVNVTGAVSAAAIAGGLVTSTTAAAVAGTVPTGAVMDASALFSIGDALDWSVINTGGANAFTVTAASGHTLVGAAVVAASTSGSFRTRKTAAATFVTYRL